MCNRKGESLDGSLDDGGVRDESTAGDKLLLPATDENNNQICQTSKTTKGEPTSLVARVQLFLDQNVNRFQTEIRWTHVLFMLTFHLVSLHALVFLILPFRVKLQTILFAIFLHYLCNIGLTAGVHRLWSHKGKPLESPILQLQ